jgi:hypothetical protein
MPLDSPYELSEEALKRILLEYKGSVVMPFATELRDQDRAATAIAVPWADAPEREPAQGTEELTPSSAVQLEDEILLESLASSETFEPDVSGTGLLAACAKGDLRTVTWLLDHGVDADVRDENNNTALMVACRNCHGEVARLLLQRGADVNARDKYGRTAMEIAADWGYPSIIELVKEFRSKESGQLYR